MPRPLPLVAALTLALLAGACEKGDPAAQGTPTGVGIGHLFVDSATGVAIDLPANWKGRYQVRHDITAKAEGLLAQVSIHFVKADKSVETDSAMLTARVFAIDGWRKIEGDSLKRTVFGSQAARNEERAAALTLRLSTGNPLTPGSADALGYDSLMIALFGRPMRAGLEKPFTSTGPAAPATSSP